MGSSANVAKVVNLSTQSLLASWRCVESTNEPLQPSVVSAYAMPCCLKMKSADRLCRLLRTMMSKPGLGSKWCVGCAERKRCWDTPWTTPMISKQLEGHIWRTPIGRVRQSTPAQRWVKELLQALPWVLQLTNDSAVLWPLWKSILRLWMFFLYLQPTTTYVVLNRMTNFLVRTFSEWKCVIHFQISEISRSEMLYFTCILPVFYCHQNRDILDLW